MRSEMDVYRAHDILVACVLKEVPVTMSPSSALGLHAALDALCWVLGHDDGKHGCNVEFGENLKQIEEALAQRGFVLHRKNN